MATRFGAITPAQKQQAKIRLFLACLFSVFLVFVIAVVILFNNSQAAPEELPVEEAPPVVAAQDAPVEEPMVDVLVAAQRIEQGTQLQDYMFKPKPWDAESLPEQVVLAADIESIRGKFADKLIQAHLPIVQDDVTEQAVPEITIPPGYRAVTIDIDTRSAVEGFAKANSRVDVLFAYNDKKGRKKVSTIVHFVKILSVGGVTGAQGAKAGIGTASTATLLVTERDAKRIELARTEGKLSLTLVGNNEAGASSEEPGSITVEELFTDDDDEAVEEHDGSMYMTDPKSGRQIRYVLKAGRWVREEEF